MNRKLISTRTEGLSRRRFLVAAAAAPVAFVAARVAGQDPIPEEGGLAMGTIGVAAGQKLRVSVFEHGEIPGSPCVFRIDIYGINGELLGTHTGEVFAGKGAFADFDVAANLRKPDRVQVHVMVTGDGTEPLLATAEIFDVRTGQTSIPDSPCVTPRSESPRDPASSVGITRNHAVRLSFFHHPSANQIPCDLIGSLIALDGTVLTAFQGSIFPGKGFAFDWGEGSQGFPVLASGERLQVHAEVHVEHPDEVGMTGEVFDLKTGATLFDFIPCSA